MRPDLDRAALNRMIDRIVIGAALLWAALGIAVLLHDAAGLP